MCASARRCVRAAQPPRTRAAPRRDGSDRDRRRRARGGPRRAGCPRGRAPRTRGLIGPTREHGAHRLERGPIRGPSSPKVPASARMSWRTAPTNSCFRRLICATAAKASSTVSSQEAPWHAGSCLRGQGATGVAAAEARGQQAGRTASGGTRGRGGSCRCCADCTAPAGRPTRRACAQPERATHGAVSARTVLTGGSRT